MKVSLFPDAFTSRPVVVDTTWDALVDTLTRHEVVSIDWTVPNVTTLEEEEKKRSKTWSPAEFDGRKTDDQALRVHAGVLDFDGVPTETVGAILQAAAGTDYVVYSSWSHGWKKPGWTFRLVLRLSRPVEAYEWPRFWEAMTSAYGFGAHDVKCSNIGRVYFGPRCPLVPGVRPFAWANPGKPLDVDAALRTGARRRISRDDLHALAQEHKSKRPSLYRGLMALTTGEPYADPGERDTVIFDICRFLAAKHQDLDVDSVVEWFAASTATMTTLNAGTPSLDVVREKLERIVGEQTQKSGGGGDIGLALGNPNRKHPYSDSELDAIAAAQGCDRDSLARRWVLLHRGAYYFLTANGYVGPFSKDDASVAAGIYLSPSPVPVSALKKDGTKVYRTIADIATTNGTPLTAVCLDMTASAHRYDPDQQVMYERGKTLRDLPATFDHEVATWLQLMTGDSHHDVKSWLAALTQLTDPCVALFFTGPGGAGKSLFAEGCARLWTTYHATPIEQAMQKFNDTLIKCPLVFADESLPTSYRGENRTQEVRQFIQARTFSLGRKYLPEVTAIGAIRLVVAANNDQILKLSGELNEHDIKAITDRFLHVPVGRDAVEYLRRLPDGGKSFVTEDRLAKHALWLRSNHKWSPTGRFLIESTKRDLYDGLVNTVGLRSKVLSWLVDWCLSEAALPEVYTQNGAVWVTSRCISAHWQLFIPHGQPPSIAVVSRVLKNLSTEAKKSRGTGSRFSKFYRVNPLFMVQWAETTDAVLPEELIGRLTR